MGLKFKRLGLFRKAKERRETPEILCLRYVQRQEFDICYIRTPLEIRASPFRPPPDTEPIETQPNPTLNQSESTAPPSRNPFRQSTPDIQEPKHQIVPAPRAIHQSTRTNDLINQSEAEGDAIVQSEEPEVVRPIAMPRSILKNAIPAPKSEEEDEDEKKSTLIFMTENHEDSEETEAKEETKTGKTVMFDEENLLNKGEVIDKVEDSEDDYDSDEYQKDFSRSAASIFFDGGDADPSEHMARICLSRDEDAESQDSQSSV